MPPLNKFKKTIIALAISQIGVTTAHSAVINVSAGCNLASAIRSANNDVTTANCTAGSGADIINIPTQVITLTAAAGDGSQYGDSGLPLIRSNITIEGNDSTIVRNSVNDFRIIALEKGNPNAKLTLNSVTISNGLAQSTTASTGYGGGIYAGTNTTLTINDSTISGNQSNYGGGGVYAYKAAEVHINNSTISNNTADTTGGGFRANQTPIVSISGSTISNNTVQNGKGAAISVYNAATEFSMSNSTISGNTSVSAGNGIHVNNSSLQMTNVTVTNNSVANSLTIQGDAALTIIITINNTVIANTKGGNDCDFTNNVDTFNYTNSWFFDTTTNATCTGGVAQGDPLLLPLTNNGGPTETHLPATNLSELINAGDNTICTNLPVNALDQRGVSRPPTDSSCDIGAVENNISVFANGFEN